MMPSVPDLKLEPPDDPCLVLDEAGLVMTAYDETVENCLRQTRRILLRLGTLRFGPPATDVEAVICSSNDLDQLERMAVAVLTAKDWSELLSTW